MVTAKDIEEEEEEENNLNLINKNNNHSNSKLAKITFEPSFNNILTNSLLNDNTSSSASSSSASSGRHIPEYQQNQNKNSYNSSNSSSEFQNLIKQSILFGQQQNLTLPQTATTPFSFASLNYGPFGLPSFSLSPQGHSLLHFPPQLQQQQEIERQQTAMLSQQKQQNYANAGLVATQSAYEGLPIFLMPNTGTLSLNALQQATEFKTMAALLQQQQNLIKIDTSKHFHVFVGDLSQDVDNHILNEAFSKFGQVSEAKVMRDPQSTKSRSFGFVSFPSREDAERAIEEMNGVQLGRRTIRTGWAVKKSSSEQTKTVSSEEEKEEYSTSTATFESIYNSSEADNTTIYLGGLSSSATEEPLKKVFSEFGIIKEIRLFTSQNFGFVVFSDKTSATKAILAMHGKELNLGIVAGKCRLRVKWGKPIQQQQNNNNNGGNNVWNNEANNNLVSIALNQQNSAAAAALISQQQQQIALTSALLQAQQQQTIFQSPMLIGGQTPIFNNQSHQFLAQIAAQQQQQNLQQSVANNTFINSIASNWPQTQQF